MKKNILFLHNSLDIGGAEQLRYTILKNLDRSKYNIRICCIDKRGYFGEKIQELGYPVDELNLSYRPINLLTTLRVLKYLKKNNIDILQTSLFNANFHGRIAAIFCQIPFVIAEEHSEHFQYKGARFFPYILANILLSFVSNLVICCSKSVRDDIVKRHFLPSKKVITITNCIEPANYNVKIEKREIREKFKITDEMVFITVSSLSERKGHKYLIETCRELKKRGMSFKCFLAGDGPLKNKLIEMCKELKLNNEIIFLGNIENVADYLNASDVFVLPSLAEGLSIALMEAMYMRLPCIVTDVGSNRELIEDKKNGIVIQPDDTNELVDALLYCFNNKERLEEFGFKNRLIIEKGYLIKDYVENFYKIWDEARTKNR